MRHAFGFLMLFISGSLSAEVLTLDCTPDHPVRESRDLNTLVVDTTDNTVEMNNDVVFPNAIISERVIYAEGKESYLSYTLEISRMDLTYKKTQWLNAYETSVKRKHTGQCKVVQQ